MKRAEFVFFIGFEGKNAFYDGTLAKRYGKKNTVELLKLGLYKAAFCSALFDGTDVAQQQLLEWFKQHSLFNNKTFEELRQLFGVKEIPQNVVAIKV